MICLLAFLAREGLGQADRLDDLADLALVGGALEGLGREQPRADELLGDRRGAARPAARPCRAPAETMPTGSKPGLLQKSLSSIAVVASMISPGIWS